MSKEYSKDNSDTVKNGKEEVGRAVSSKEELRRKQYESEIKSKLLAE